jgi:hypothetical protein
LYSQSGDVRKLIAQYPDVRQYFFNNKKIDKDHDDYARTRTLAELYLNYMEHFIIQAPNLRRKDWGDWQETLLNVYDSTPIIQEALSEDPKWYCKAVHDFFTNRGCK